MRTHPRIAFTVLCLAWAIASCAAEAAQMAEIHLKGEHQCRDWLVLLGDVADIHHPDPAKAAALAEIELFPAPAAGRWRSVRAGEIQELLILRSVNLRECRFSGASVVRIGSAAQTAAGPATRGKVVRAVSHSSEQAAELHLFPQQTAEPPALVVAARRSLRRGERIHGSDVEFQPAPTQHRGLQFVDRLEDVVGKETTRSIATGQPIDERAVQEPLFVRRREIVTVFARAAGVQVRTNARALEDGAHGALITVESLDNRQHYRARVIGIQEVEVYARGAAVEG